MRVVLHGLPDDVGDFVELAIVHFDEGMEDTALNRFEAVVHMRNGAILDYVGRVFDEVGLIETIQVSHDRSYSRLAMMYSRRSGVFLPMKNSSIPGTVDIDLTLTLTRRMSGPMNWPNSEGEISPNPLNRVTSG